jgi:hypothetical protein
VITTTSNRAKTTKSQSLAKSTKNPAGIFLKNAKRWWFAKTSEAYNATNPNAVIQLFLAADWTILAGIYGSVVGPCPGIVANWTNEVSSLDSLAPGDNKLYLGCEFAVSEAVTRNAYEVEHGGLRVAIGTLKIDPATRELRVGPLPVNTSRALER